MNTVNENPISRTKIVQCVGNELIDYGTRAMNKEFEILSCKVGPGNAAYTLTLRYPKAQQELIP